MDGQWDGKERRVRDGKKGMLIVTVRDLPRLKMALEHVLQADGAVPETERRDYAHLLQRVQSRI
jgi:hypothetical protein